MDTFSSHQAAEYALMANAFSGFFWIMTYILIILLAFRQKTYGMPLIAISANIAWEFLYTFIFTDHHSSTAISFGLNLASINKIVMILWFSLDCIIVYTYFRFGKKYFPKMAGGKFFLINFILVMLAGFAMQYLGYYYFKFYGMKFPQTFTAFVQNLIMSVLFLTMLFSRKNTEGQSMYIAIFKLVGTLFASLAAYVIDPTYKGAHFNLYYLLPIVAALTFIYDSAYCYFLYQQFKRESKNPFGNFWGKDRVPIPA